VAEGRAANGGGDHQNAPSARAIGGRDGGAEASDNTGLWPVAADIPDQFA